MFPLTLHTSGCHGAPTVRLKIYCLCIWQVRSVVKVWEASTIYDPVDLFLGFSLDLGVEHHGEEKYSQYCVGLVDCQAKKCE